MTAKNTTPATFDIDDLTLREVSLIENKAGMSINAMNDSEKYMGGLMAAIYWVAMKRTDPSFTWEQAQDTKMSVVSEFLGGGDDPNSEN